jgi:hypothetical protein
MVTWELNFFERKFILNEVLTSGKPVNYATLRSVNRILDKSELSEKDREKLKMKQDKTGRWTFDQDQEKNFGIKLELQDDDFKAIYPMIAEGMITYPSNKPHLQFARKLERVKDELDGKKMESPNDNVIPIVKKK